MKSLKKAFILAAGYGERMRPLTERQPKPSINLHGHPLIENVFDFLKQQGITEIVVNTHHHPEVFKQLYQDQTLQGQSLKWIYEPELLNTGGGLKNVEKEFKEETFLMINGDVLFEGELDKAIKFHQKNKAIATMILSPYHGPKHVSISEKGKVEDIRGIINVQSPSRYTFTGIHILEPEIFKNIPKDVPISIIDVYLDLIRQGKKIFGYVWMDGLWIDVGLLGLYHLLEEGCYVEGAPNFLKGKKNSRKVIDFLHYEDFHQPTLIRLPQDGSDRVYYRTGQPPDTRIVMFYGLEKEENAHFVSISKFLKELGLAVPTILNHDPEHRIVVMQDLGLTRLYDIYPELNYSEIKNVYQKIIDQILILHQKGSDIIKDKSVHLSCPFNFDYYHWEANYFKENYLIKHRGLDLNSKEIKVFDEWTHALAEKLSKEPQGLVHRDLQSKNIMVKDDLSIYLIDYQGMRYGLTQYDLASLLLDPYIPLDPNIGQELLDYYIHQAAIQDRNRFLELYYQTALQRLMQAMGAFCYLSYSKGKNYFLNYIPQAQKNMMEVCNALRIENIFIF